VRLFRCLPALLGLLSIAAPALAWSASGHSAIAALAHRNLDAATRRRIAKVLESHPAYAQWRAGLAQAGVAPELYLMMRASAWPDEVRNDPKQHRPEWHYINRAYAPGNPEATLPEAEDDIVKAIAKNKEAFIAEEATPADKAIALSWLMHLVGDVHQPLHAVTLVTDEFPQGDRGGNSFLIQAPDRSPNLHAFWDRLFDTHRSPKEAVALAAELTAKHPRSSLPEAGLRNPRDWAAESYWVAVRFAYVHYPDADQPFVIEPLKPGAPLPTGYAERAREQAARRAALAGYRLKEALWGLFYGQE